MHTYQRLSLRHDLIQRNNNSGRRNKYRLVNLDEAAAYSRSDGYFMFCILQDVKSA